jgi:hypothetical protein
MANGKESNSVVSFAPPAPRRRRNKPRCADRLDTADRNAVRGLGDGGELWTSAGAACRGKLLYIVGSILSGDPGADCTRSALLNTHISNSHITSEAGKIYWGLLGPGNCLDFQGC